MSGRFYGRIAIINLLGNVAAFIPIGFFLPIVWKKFAGFFKTILFIAGVSVMIEITHYAFGVGAADIDDLILNLAGGLIGYVFYILAVNGTFSLKR